MTNAIDTEETTIDLGRPTFEIWLDGTRFASTQVPAAAKRMYDRMTCGESAKRYGLRTVEFRVSNDRREVSR